MLSSRKKVYSAQKLSQLPLLRRKVPLGVGLFFVKEVAWRI